MRCFPNASWLGHRSRIYAPPYGAANPVAFSSFDQSEIQNWYLETHSHFWCVFRWCSGRHRNASHGVSRPGMSTLSHRCNHAGDDLGYPIAHARPLDPLPPLICGGSNLGARVNGFCLLLLTRLILAQVTQERRRAGSFQDASRRTRMG